MTFNVHSFTLGGVPFKSFRYTRNFFLLRVLLKCISRYLSTYMTGFTDQSVASPDNQFQVLYHTLRFNSRSDPPARNQVNTGFCVSSHMISSWHLFVSALRE